MNEKEPIYVTLSSMPDFNEYCNEIRDLWTTHWLTNNGIKHKQLEKDIQAFLHTDNVSLFVNGHSALESIISAYHFPKDSEVITTPFTFASTTHAIVRCGLRPVFCDISPEDYNIDPEKIEQLITPKTVAIIPVHVYGNVCDVERIQQIATKYRIKLIYDAAHAFGVKYKGTDVANFGDASIYSFHATKVFHTIEGGAVCFRDPNLAKELNESKNFGLSPNGSVDYIGGNAKMNEFCAAMGICNLRHINDSIRKRKIIAEHYFERLSNIEGIHLSIPRSDITSNYIYLPVNFDGYKISRNEVFERMEAQNIKAKKYFSALTNDLNCYKDWMGFNSDLTPVAKSVAQNILTLPLYSDLEIDAVDLVCDTILQ